MSKEKEAAGFDLDERKVPSGIDNEGYQHETNFDSGGVGPPPSYADIADNKVVLDEERGALEEEDGVEEEEDPWQAVPFFRKKEVTPWHQLNNCQKIWRVGYDWIFLTFFKICSLLGLLYIFVCSLQIMSAAFQLLGGKAAGEALSQDDIISNPVCGLMIGVLVTVLVQSSSTSTSIVVSMVGAGVLTVSQAIPIIMGANIGTSVTNTIVAITQAKDRNEFRRAFGGATVHDMFNWLSVLILLPLEVATGYLEVFSSWFLSLFDIGPNADADKDFLDAITKPVTNKIVQINKAAITDIALNQTDGEDVSLLKRCAANETGKSCEHLFAYTEMSDAAVGAILLALSLFLLCTCLYLIVKLLQWALQGNLAIVVRKAVNADFPGCLSFLTGYFAILMGAILTFLVQSSSVFTSSLTPLVGMGLITIDRIYPLTLGSNIGTTGTSILAAFSQTSNFGNAMQISMCHLFFNITGIVIWYPIPYLRAIPIHIAKNLGNNTAKYRWFAVIYLIMVFLVMPAVVFALSLAGYVIFACIAAPIFFVLAVIVLINVFQAKCRSKLPVILQDWTFLPKFMRSLQPYDEPFKKIGACCSKCCDSICCCCSTSGEVDLESASTVDEEKMVVSTVS